MVSHGVAAGVEHKQVLRRLANIQMIADIGANRGQFALVARHCFPDAVIYSFEPLPDPAKLFRQVFCFDSNVYLYESAVGKENVETTIHISARDDSSSLLPITDIQNQLFPGTAEQSTRTIRVCRLEELLKQDQVISPALLKLDVQGYELEALCGCGNLLSRFYWIYVECSFVELYDGQALAGEVIAWLRERKFELTGCYNMAYDLEGRAIQADLMFERMAADR